MKYVNPSSFIIGKVKGQDASRALNPMHCDPFPIGRGKAGEICACDAVFYQYLAMG